MRPRAWLRLDGVRWRARHRARITTTKPVESRTRTGGLISSGKKHKRRGLRVHLKSARLQRSQEILTTRAHPVDVFLIQNVGCRLLKQISSSNDVKNNDRHGGSAAACGRRDEGRHESRRPTAAATNNDAKRGGLRPPRRTTTRSAAAYGRREEQRERHERERAKTFAV